MDPALMVLSDAAFRRTVAAFTGYAVTASEAARQLVAIGWTAEQAWAFVMMLAEQRRSGSDEV